jgi:CubicO group peptidase (beta-lactamase class C family)
LEGYGTSQPEDLAALLEPIRAEHDLPSLAGAILTADKLVALGAVGTRIAGEDVPVRRDDVYHLGSCTKAMTATLLGILVEEGKLRLDQPLRELLPEAYATARPDYQNVTLAQVMAHRAGLVANLNYQSYAKADTIRAAREQFCADALQHEPTSAPGTDRLYSNVGFIIAGHVAERILDQDWETAIAQRIFGPLGITTGGFGTPDLLGLKIAPWPHELKDGLAKALKPGSWTDNREVLGPAGRVHMNLADWSRFVALHLRGAAGRDDLLKAATIQALQDCGADEGYSCGWGRTERGWAGGVALTHTGSNTLNFCAVWASPSKGFAVLAATNIAGDAAAKGVDQACWQMIQKHLKTL